MTRRGTSLMRSTRRMMLGTVLGAAMTVLAAPAVFASPETDAADAINQAWQAAGGAGSIVGGRDGDVYQVGAGYGQKFTDGKIFFSPGSGAHLMSGAILDKYESLGGPADSDLGFPNIDEVPGLVGPDSRVSTFDASDKPAIFWTPETGAWAVRGALNAAWDKLGGSAGTLGVPTEDERYDGDVVSQKFSGGELSWNVKTNTFTTTPAQLADNLAGLDVPRDPTTMINLAWRAAGGLGGQLGARQGEQTPVGSDGAAQGYAGGKIFYTPQTGGYAVTGAILSKYESMGGPTGDLGLPIGPEADAGVPNSRISPFSAADKPVIFWTPDTGAVVVRGPINAAWEKLGGATGTLGAPTGEQSVKGDVVTQDFSGGQISWNTATKEFSTKPPELAADLSGLELPDGVAQAPAGGAGDGTSEGGWRWWWLAIIVPLLLLFALLAVWAQRRSSAADRREEPGHTAGYGGFGPDDVSRDRWPGDGSASEWSAPEFDNDEDAIDTAPTRIPTEAELDEFGATIVEPGAEPSERDFEWDLTWDNGTDTDSGYTDSGTYTASEFGRHSAGETGAVSSWQLDIGDRGAPRRRHAVDEATPWATDFGDSSAESAAVADERHDESPGDSDGSWRPAIHLPLADPFQPPEGYVIKANTHSGLYYTPESMLYDNTVPEVWFASEEVAQANGFVRAPE